MKPGAPATLERWSGLSLEARVRAIEPSGYTKLSALGVEEQRVDVVLDIVRPAEQWASLGDGFRVHAKILVHRETTTIKTAAAAIIRDGAGRDAATAGSLHKPPACTPPFAIT